MRQAIAYAIDRERLNEIATQGTVVRRQRDPALLLQATSTPSPSRPIPTTPSWRIRSSTTRAGCRATTGSARRTASGSRSTSTCARSRPYTVQMAKLIAESTAEIGIEYNVQVVSTDKLTELTVRKVDGKPAPEFDTFIWGWGGDPYDPSLLLGLADDRPDRRLLGRLLLEPGVRPAVRGAGDHLRRRGAPGGDRARWSRSPRRTCPTSS